MRRYRAIPWEVEGIFSMTPKQKYAIVGMILGDAYLQSTGKQNARLRLEHSSKQKEYLLWKVNLLKNYFQSKPILFSRLHPLWKKTYEYIRIQSMSSSELGKYQKLFYKEKQKIIPENIAQLLKNPLTLAIWFMDDGYYYPRDKMSYIYIPRFKKEHIDILLSALNKNFSLFPKVKEKKKGLVLVFNVMETRNLMELIKSFIIPAMNYKIPFDPVSTDQNSDVIGGVER